MDYVEQCRKVKSRGPKPKGCVEFIVAGLSSGRPRGRSGAPSGAPGEGLPDTATPRRSLPGCLREGAKSYAKVKHVLRRRRG